MIDSKISTTLVFRVFLVMSVANCTRGCFRSSSPWGVASMTFRPTIDSTSPASAVASAIQTLALSDNFV